MPSPDKGSAASRDPLQNPAFRPPGLFESLRELLLGSSRPLACAQIEVSSCCQSRCSYCPRSVHARTWQSRQMQPETFASLWPLLRNARRAHLQGWGEPLLNPRFFDFQSLAAKAGCATSTTTCGMVMNHDIAHKLASSGLDIIAFSLVGTDNASNSARVGAPFDQVCANIALLQEEIAKLPETEQPEVHFAYLLLPDRLDALSGLPDLMERLNVSCAVISTMDYLPGESQAANMFRPGEDHSAAQAILEEISDRVSKLGRSIHYSLPARPKPEGTCREDIGSTVFISADGDISPCVYLNVPEGRPGCVKRIFGNSLQKNAWEIWQQEDYASFRSNLAANQPEPVCAACPKRHEA